LIVYFIGNIVANKISKSIHVRQSYSNPKVGRFFETRCIYINNKCTHVIPPAEKNLKQIRDNGQISHSNCNVDGFLQHQLTK